jgi:tRNA-splicing ligase RtcB
MKLLGKNENIPVFGEPLLNAVEQMDFAIDHGAVKGALMADHHLGYSVPVGGVIAYKDAISPSGVGFDIGCGNKAVMTDMYIDDIDDMEAVMDAVAKNISFGIGRVSKSKHIAGQADAGEHELFDKSVWSEINMLSPLKEMARNQLGTVGSGNHYVDIFADELGRVWIGVHFGSRGLGHKIASHYIKAGGGVDGINVAPAVLDVNTDLGREYIAAMTLAGEYAYAGRDWVCDEVARILRVKIVDSVHNHHNFAWRETHNGEDLWVVRKGATPAFPSQRGFVGGTMGENSVILEGVESEMSAYSLYSTVHGAGRVMSRTEAAGKTKWKNGVKTRVSEGKISHSMMNKWLEQTGVVLRGGGLDEAPQAYKRLHEVLESQGDTIKVTHTLKPLGVAMAGEDIFDPYKD